MRTKLIPALLLASAGLSAAWRGAALFAGWRGALHSPPRAGQRRGGGACPSMGLFDFAAGSRDLPGAGKKVKMGPLEISEMGIGTWSWGNRLLWGYDESMDGELQQVFDLCVSKGVNFFDTGDSYGTGKLEGQAEKLLGKFMEEYAAKRGGAASAYPYIGTKLATYPWRLTSGSMVSACEKSAERLRRPVDVGQIHWSAANYAPWQEKALWEGLVRMQRDGLVKTVGVSNYGPKQLRKIHKYLTDEGVELASNQIQYSLLSRTVGDQVKEVCDELGIAMIAYSPLGLGVLGGKYRKGGEVPAGPRGFVLKDRINEAEVLLACLDEVAQQRGKTSAQVAINWCMCKGAVPIPGAKSLTQASSNLGAMGWRLSLDEVEELDLAARKVPSELVQNVFQTT